MIKDSTDSSDSSPLKLSKTVFCQFQWNSNMFRWTEIGLKLILFAIQNT